VRLSTGARPDVVVVLASAIQTGQSGPFEFVVGKEGPHGGGAPGRRRPFDRLLVAQARIEGLTLVTRDPLIRSYPGVAFLPA
jgi:hypothetical protein